MSSSKNPFAVTQQQKSPSSGTVIPWVLAVAAAIGLALTLGLWHDARKVQRRELAGLQDKLERATAQLAGSQAMLETNQALVTVLTNQIADLQKEKEMAGQMAKTLEEEMRADLESKDVTISKLQGKLTVSIVDRVMFDSGEAILKPDGAAVMQKIADLLKAHPELKVHVIGHTDNIPIRPAAHSRFATNWELSVARALAAVHFLTEKAGVDARRLGALGYGEFHPVADNSTEQGRAKNRRIEITVLPEEATEPEATRVASGPATTNAVPTASPDNAGD